MATVVTPQQTIKQAELFCDTKPRVGFESAAQVSRTDKEDTEVEPRTATCVCLLEVIDLMETCPEFQFSSFQPSHSKDPRDSFVPCLSITCT